MNLKNLNMVFAHYIQKFVWLNTKPEPDEGYKWFAVKNFQTVFNLDVSDDEFPAMLQAAKKATENLIDSSQQPFAALCEYAKREPATIRNMFRELYKDDGGNLQTRQKKIDSFLVQAEDLRKKYYPTSHLFVNSQRSVMAYLWFYDPDTYYYYKATEAKYLADCVEFYDDWGTYSDFHMDVYYRFCDEIVTEIRKNTALMETHQSRFYGQAGSMHPDKELHILLVDIIFCSMRYGLYNGIPIKDASAPAKRLYIERKTKAAELMQRLQAAEENAALLEEAKEVFVEMIKSGSPITHKAYGEAKLIDFSNGCCTLYFERTKEQKKFMLLPALVGRFIRISSPDFDRLFEKYYSVMKTETSIPKQVDLALKALEPYKEYID